MQPERRPMDVPYGPLCNAEVRPLLTFRGRPLPTSCQAADSRNLFSILVVLTNYRTIYHPADIYSSQNQQQEHRTIREICSISTIKTQEELIKLIVWP